MSLINRHRRATGETPEQTLTRLNAATGRKAHTPVKTSRKWIGLVLAGAACLLLGGSMLTEAVSLVRGGDKTAAVVLSTHYDVWSEHQVPTVEYRVDGVTYQADVDPGYSVQIGDQVDITYDPNDPENLTAGWSGFNFVWPLAWLAGGAWLTFCGLSERKDPRWV